MLAQKTAEETQETALRNAHAIEKEALTKSEIIVSDAKRELERIHQKTVQLCQQYEKYKLQFKNLAAAQIELLETESYQIHIMDVPQVTMPEMAAMPQPEAVIEEPATEEFSFVNVASEND